MNKWGDYRLNIAKSFFALYVYRYLLKDQLQGPSSVDAYIRALAKGCRCVECEWRKSMVGWSVFRLNISKLRNLRVLVNSCLLHRVHHPIIW